MALLTSMIAPGGVGVAKSAITWSTSAVRSAVGDSVGKHPKNPSHEPFHQQYSFARRTSASTAPGYPVGLSGETIPLKARIVNAADAYCAMTRRGPTASQERRGRAG
jgi:hypothetical protein